MAISTGKFTPQYCGAPDLTLNFDKRITCNLLGAKQRMRIEGTYQPIQKDKSKEARSRSQATLSDFRRNGVMRYKKAKRGTKELTVISIVISL